LPAPFLDLGSMPLANSFLASPADAAHEARYPLAVAACGECGLAQLTHVVPAATLYRDYIYVSSTSEAVRAHAASLAERCSARYGWSGSSLVVEVASNDGTVLKAMQQRGLRVLGVEPALNVAAIAQAAGVPTVPEFFNESTAMAVRAEHGEAAAILGRHVFAHVDDVHDFLRGVDRVLARDGVLLLEVPYFGELVDKLEFDTVYHEHLSYFAIAPVARLCADHGLSLVDVEPVDLHGGSVIFHIQRGTRPPSARMERMLAEERARRLLAPETLDAFVTKLAAWKARFEALVADTVARGGRLIGYGAAAKANTLLNHCPDVARALACILDRSAHKQGRYTPGTHRPVVSADEWKASGATHMLILAWNFREEIMRQMKPFADAGGRFVIPIPEPEIV
jgi:novobiocin biosynthesis protein NovU/D-mycarose 3-C-methyltransferase